MKRIVSTLSTSDINATLRANESGLLRSSGIKSERCVAGTFSVDHDLGDIPDDFLYSRIDNVDVYATAIDRASWTSTSAVLTGSAAGDVRLWFVKRL